MDEKVFDELEKIIGNKNDNEEGNLFPEYAFLVSCLRIGLRLEDLKYLTYIDVLKMFISFIGKPEKQDGTREATQEDIQNLVARM